MHMLAVIAFRCTPCTKPTDYTPQNHVRRTIAIALCWLQAAKRNMNNNAGLRQNNDAKNHSKTHKQCMLKRNARLALHLPQTCDGLAILNLRSRMPRGPLEPIKLLPKQVAHQ